MERSLFVTSVSVYHFTFLPGFSRVLGVQGFFHLCQSYNLPEYTLHDEKYFSHHFAYFVIGGLSIIANYCIGCYHGSTPLAFLQQQETSFFLI